MPLPEPKKYLFQQFVVLDRGRAYTPFEQRETNAANVALAAQRLANGAAGIGPSQDNHSVNSLFYDDIGTVALGFYCDSTLIPARTPKCTSEQQQARMLLSKSMSTESIDARIRAAAVSREGQLANAKANKPMNDYVNEITYRSTPETKEAIRKAMVERALISPNTLVTDSRFINSLYKFYNGPLTLGSSTAAAAQQAERGRLAALTTYADKANANDIAVYQSYRAEAQAPGKSQEDRALFNRLADELSQKVSRANANVATNAANGANADEQTIKDNLNEAIISAAKADAVALRKSGFDQSDSLAKAIAVQSNSLRGAGGLTPVAPPAPKRPVSKKPLPKPKGRR